MEATSAFATFSESPSLEALCTLLQLPQDRVVCAYQFGSRVWQTADATSDWDYRLVIDGWQGPEHLDDRCPFIDAWY